MINLRYVTIRGVRYLHVDDVAEFIREIGGTEETDVRRRLEEAANNLKTGDTTKTKVCVRCTNAKITPSWTCRVCSALCCEHLCSFKEPDFSATCNACVK